jgi:DNA modification methylase
LEPGNGPLPATSNAKSQNSRIINGRRSVNLSSAALRPFTPNIEALAIDQIKPAKRNARTHAKKQVDQIAASMLRFGVLNPIIIDSENVVVAGHGRLAAAISLGLKTMPAIRASHLSEAEIRAYRLADNKIALNAGWDRELLAVELGELQSSLSDLEMGLSITGFEPHEVDSIFNDFAEAAANPADDIPAIVGKVSAKDGEVYRLGNHRLCIGDARNEQLFFDLLGDQRADMAFLDPPYNVRVNGHVGGKGRIKHREFACASGEMTSSQFETFLTETLGHCTKLTKDGGIHFVCMDWRHISELQAAGNRVYDELLNICVWVKTNPGMGSFYRSQHELVFAYKHGKSPHLNNVQLGRHGRSRSNVWSYPGVNAFKTGRMDELMMHPTVKPVAMIVDVMRDCTKQSAVILDAFCGSGSTIIAAEQIGRRAYCIEIDPQYAEIAILRWQAITGKDAVLETTGQTFDEIRAIRLATSASSANDLP